MPTLTLQRLLTVVALLACLASCGSSAGPAEPRSVLFFGGEVITNNPDAPRAQAVAVADGRVLVVGSEAEARAALGEGASEEIDLDGALLYPGFADAHAHLTGIGQAQLSVDLVGTASYAEVIERIRAYAAAHPGSDWITGRGWDQNDWAVQEFPHHGPLSEAFPERPVLVRRVDGHAALANAAAMAAASISSNTADPEGGRVLRGADGAATGVFVDAGMGLVGGSVPPLSQEQVREAIRLGVAELHRNGLTSIHDAGASRAEIELYRAMAQAGELPLRVHVMISGGDQAGLDYWLDHGPEHDLDGDGQVVVRAIKLYADGALGSRGAALLEPYHDDADNLGLIITPMEEVQAIAARALAAGFQVCTHAIGDRGNRLVLNAYAGAFAAHQASGQLLGDVRFRVEHAQVLSPLDIPRFAELGVLASMQAQHQTSDMPWAEARLGGERVRGAYAWRALLDTGVMIPGGSDAPVEVLDPLGAFYAATTRRNRADEPAGGWYPEQRMTRQEALEHLTLWPAHAAFREHDLGAVRPGFRADFTVLDRDLLRASEDQLLQAQVRMTVVGGVVVFRADS